MSENCNQSCSSCSEDCAERKEQKTDFSVKLHDMSSVKKVIGVVSGKGGVGKSLVTSMLAVTMSRREYKTAILDADVTGPSIPKVFGIKEKAAGDEFGLFPVKTKTGIDVMSVNLLLENDTDPVVFRGPIISGTVKQFLTDVIWSNIDYMFIDMPPGTGDVALTVFQSIPWMDYHRYLSSGIGVHDCVKGCKNGGNDEYSYHRSGRKFVLFQMSGQ